MGLRAEGMGLRAEGKGLGAESLGLRAESVSIADCRFRPALVRLNRIRLFILRLIIMMQG